jgi:hypothetical protein
LRRALDAPIASLLAVTGLPGIGKTRVVRRAARDYLTVHHLAPPLSEPQQRAALIRSLAGTLGSSISLPGSDVPTWDEIFAVLVASAPEGRPLVLVVDDAHRWDESRARFREPLGAALGRARKAARTVHVVLVSPEPLPEPVGLEPPALELTLHSLPFRAAAALLPGETARDRLRAFAVFGGIPGHLAHVDPAASLGSNLRRAVFSPDAPLADAPLVLLERSFQTPARYAAVLAALAPGEGDWGTVHAGVPDLSASGQAAPYLKRLEQVGLVEARRSLDAPPTSRGRRYRVRDPFVSFWFRFVLPHRERFGADTSDTLYSEVVRTELDRQVASLLPQVCRDFMAHDALESLGANARECGSLWGPGYDIPVAGTLATGAPFYGTPVADEAAASALQRLDTLVRETRYGFGRERRLRLLFTQDPPPASLQREAARRHDTILVGVEALAGVGG